MKDRLIPIYGIPSHPVGYEPENLYKKRQFYASKLHLEQNMKGIRYKDFLPVYVVAILSESASIEMSLYSGCADQVIYGHTMIEKISGIFAPRTISAIFVRYGQTD